MRVKNETICDLQNDKFCLEEQIDSLKSGETNLQKEGKTYSSDMRMFVYDSIVNNVPMKNVPILLKQFTRRSGVMLEKVPHRSTVEFMARELGIISDFQAAEAILKEKNLTLGFDATTQDDLHVNRIHVTSKSDCHVLAVDQLAVGTAEDYEVHITETMDSMVDVYCKFYSNNFEETRQQMISNISNTMTDRASVNHATIVCLEDSWGTKLNELNCHLHPLDTIASITRSALKAAEPKELKKKLFGTECMASQLVLAINKFRYKDGRGDPKGYTAALSEAHLPKGLIPRYRGNRLHIMFLICERLLVHRNFFSKLFQEGTVTCGGLQSAIAQDFGNPVAEVEIQTLGLVGKLLSGPWIRRFYTASTTEVSHVDGIGIVKDVLARVRACSVKPEETLTMRNDFFGEELKQDDELARLQQSPIDSDLFRKMMEGCLTAIVTVLQKQYSRYFDLDVTEKLRNETESARCHNIDAEHVMGLFSALKDSSPNAALCYISSRIRAQKNKVVTYLDSLHPEERRKLIELSITLARKVRQKKRKKCIEIKAEILRRLAAKKHKKTTQERNKLEAKLKKSTDLAADFPEMETDTREIVQDILGGKIVGRKICHVRYNEEVQEKTIYYGKVEKEGWWGLCCWLLGC